MSYNPYITHYSSFHFLFHSPNIAPIYNPNITPLEFLHPRSSRTHTPLDRDSEMQVLLAAQELNKALQRECLALS